MTRILSALVAVLAAVMIAAGCGASGFEVEADTTVSPRDSLTKPRFIDRANMLCMRNWHVVVEAFLGYRDDLRDSEPQLTDEELFTRATRSVYFDALESYIVTRIQALGSPPGEEQAVEEVIGSMQEAIERGQRLDPVTNRPEVRALFEEYNRLARRYGLVECALGNIVLPRV